jgi:hypothetical protein
MAITIPMLTLTIMCMLKFDGEKAGSLHGALRPRPSTALCRSCPDGLFILVIIDVV